MSGTCWLPGLGTSLCSEPLTSSQTTTFRNTLRLPLLSLMGSLLLGCWEGDSSFCTRMLQQQRNVMHFLRVLVTGSPTRCKISINSVCWQSCVSSLSKTTTKEKSPEMKEVHHSLHLLDRFFREFVLTTSTPDKDTPTVMSHRAHIPCKISVSTFSQVFVYPT